MKKINPPAVKVEEIADTCYQSLRSPVKKALLATLKSHLVSEEAAYFSHGAQGTLHAMREQLTNAGHKNFLKKLYTDKVANPKGSCRSYYNKIIVQKPQICPYCEHGFITTLDHFLPKSPFPSFSITPVNLVPACSRCNSLKRSLAPSTQTDAFVHPYFEDTQKDIWLYANLDFAEGAVSFVADPGPGFSADEADKIRNTFAALKLYKPYNMEGNILLGHLRELAQKLFEKVSDTNMHGYIFLQYLQSGYEVRNSNSRNKWDTALFRTLCSTPEYYNGGFLKFGGV